MNIEISKNDISEHLWFQRLLEAQLHRETLRRAIEAGHVPADTEELRDFEVTVDKWCPTTADAVYYVETDESRSWRGPKRYEIGYTLAEIMRLAMTEPE